VTTAGFALVTATGYEISSRFGRQIPPFPVVMTGRALPRRVLVTLALLVALMGLVTSLVALAFGLS
jgi:hypothetical protein